MDRETFCLIYDICLMALVAFAVYTTRSLWPLALMIFVAFPSEEGSRDIVSISVGSDKDDEDNEESS